MRKNSTAKGYTVIELVVTLSIILLIFNYSVVRLNIISIFNNDVDVAICNNSILNIINNSKQYCRRMHKMGVIYYWEKDNSIRFYTDNNLKYRYVLPNGFKYVEANSKRMCIDINSLGFSNDACTIIYKDRKGDLHRLTMCVGTSNVEF